MVMDYLKGLLSQTGVLAQPLSGLAGALSFAELPSGAVTGAIPTKAYANALLNKTRREYPFINNTAPMVSVGQGSGYAEVWPQGEEGAPNSPRPAQFPINRFGVEVRNPTQFRPNDLAGEVLHGDPKAQAARDALLPTMTPQQLGLLKREALDYGESIRQGMSEQDAIRNMMDSAVRGYVVNQWPESMNRALNFTPQQLGILNGLRSYVTGR